MTNSLAALFFLSRAKNKNKRNKTEKLFLVALGLQHMVCGDHVWPCVGRFQLPVTMSYSGCGSPCREEPLGPDLLLAALLTWESLRFFRSQCPHVSNQADDTHPIYLPYFVMEILRTWGSNKWTDRKCSEKLNVDKCSRESSLSLCCCHHYFVVSSAFLNTVVNQVATILVSH